LTRGGGDKGPRGKAPGDPGGWLVVVGKWRYQKVGRPCSRAVFPVRGLVDNPWTFPEDFSVDLKHMGEFGS